MPGCRVGVAIMAHICVTTAFTFVFDGAAIDAKVSMKRTADRHSQRIPTQEKEDDCFLTLMSHRNTCNLHHWTTKTHARHNVRMSQSGCSRYLCDSNTKSRIHACSLCPAHLRILGNLVSVQVRQFCSRSFALERLCGSIGADTIRTITPPFCRSTMGDLP